MSKKTEYQKGDVVYMAKTGLRKKLTTNRWRRLCSVNKCEKQAQKEGLCARHLRRNQVQRRQSTRQSSIELTEDENVMLLHSPISADSHVEENIKTNTVHKDGEDFSISNIMSI